MKLITNKSKNLLYRIVPANNCTVDFQTSYAVATQISADDATWFNYKCQYWKNSTYLGEIFSGGDAGLSSIGKITKTFITPADLDYNRIIFGINGKSADSTVAFPIKLKPSTTYTFTCNFTNITQGSISWKDMMLVEGSTVGEYEPYSYNLLDKWRFEVSLTSNGVTWTNNGDGSIMVNGYATGPTGQAILRNSPVNYTHKYLFNPNYDSDSTNIAYELVFNNGNALIYYKEGKTDPVIVDISNYTNILTCTISLKRLLDSISGVYTYGYAEPVFYDLTLMYGAGNEPTTVSQFYTDHPELKVSPLGFIGLKNLDISNKNIKRLKYATTTKNLFDLSLLTDYRSIGGGYNAKDLQVKPNTTYTISTTNSNYYSDIVGTKGYAKILNSDGSNEVFIGHQTLPAASIYPGHPTTFTTDSTGKMKIAFNNIPSSEDTYKQFYEDWFANMQIEEGSTATSYVPYGYLDLGIIPSNSGYILDKYNNLSEELLEENIEKDNINYHIPDKTNILLNKIEGKTNKIVQIVDKSKYNSTSTNRGVTFTNNGNGTFTINGTNDGTDYSDPSIINNNDLTNDWLKGYKYLFYFSDKTDLNYYAVIGGSTSKMEYTEIGNTASGRSPLWKILSPTDNSVGGNSWYILRVKQNATCTNELASPQVFDLTAMYGFGKEPTTVEQFKKDYPQFFDEKLDGIWNVRTSGISTTGKNLFDVNNAANNNSSASYSISNDEIIVTQNDKTTWVSANFPIKNPGEWVGKTISISCLAKSSGINKPSIRVQWMTPNGYAIGDIAAISMPSTSTTFLGLSASGTVPEKPATADTLRFMFYSNSDGDLSGSTDSNFSCTYKDVQLEISDSATDYEPYQENKIDLLSTQTLNGINGVNDYIEVIDKGNGLYDLKKTQNIDSVDLGSLGFDVDGSNFVSGAMSSYIKPPVNDNSVGNYICQKYVNCALSKSFVNGDFGVNSSGYVYFRNSAYTTANDFNAAVTGTMLYYQLKTPVVTTIATNLTYNQVSAIRTNSGLLFVNDNSNQKYVQPDVTIKANYQYKS